MLDDGGGDFITITISGQDGLELKTAQIANFGRAIAGDGLIPAWEAIGEDLMADFALNLAGEGMMGFMSSARRMSAVPSWNSVGGWAPLAASTVRERARKGYGGAHPILWRTGLLGQSLASKGAAGNIFQATARGIVVGTSVQYAGFHQNGTRKMPARPIVGLTWARQSGIIRRLDDQVRRLLRDTGLTE